MICVDLAGARRPQVKRKKLDLADGVGEGELLSWNWREIERYICDTTASDSNLLALVWIDKTIIER